MGVVHLLVVNRGRMTKMECAMAYTEQVMVYTPASAEETILVEDLQGHVVMLGGSLVEPSPTSFLAFAYQQSGGFVINQARYEATLQGDGWYRVVRTQTIDTMAGWFTVSDTAAGVLTRSELDSVRRLLADSSVAWPTPLPAPLLECADAPWWRIATTYADNHVATFEKSDEICELPVAYQKASAVAWMLTAKLEPIHVAY